MSYQRVLKFDIRACVVGLECGAFEGETAITVTTGDVVMLRECCCDVSDA